LAKISNADIKLIRRPCNFKEFQAEKVMLKAELCEVKGISGRRNERGGKRHVLENTPDIG